MHIIVSDSSCLIDIRKAALIDAFLKLPYEILIPNTLFEDELLKFTDVQKRALISGGIKIIDLPGESVLRAQQAVREVPQLSIHDGFAFALAESHQSCILLTGDRSLRAFATDRKIEVHGLLWVIDQLHRNNLVAVKALLAALQLFDKDPTVRLPTRELAAYMRRYQALL